MAGTDDSAIATVLGAPPASSTQVGVDALAAQALASDKSFIT